MAEFTISQVARQTDLRPSALRYYEEIGLLRAPKRVNGRRRYDESVLQRLAIIQTAQRAGFTLDEICILLNDILPSGALQSQWHTLVQRKFVELNTTLLHIEKMKRLLEDVMGCDDDELADCLFVIGQKHRD